MGAAVLADLERREVELEGRDLPAQVGHLTPRDPAETIGDEGFLDLTELGVELDSVLVAAGQRRGLPGQVSARPTEAFGDEAEALPVRLVREAPAEGPVEVRQQLRVARQTGRQPTPEILRRDGGRDRLGQPRCDGLIAVQDVVGVDPERQLGDVRGD